MSTDTPEKPTTKRAGKALGEATRFTSKRYVAIHYRGSVGRGEHVQDATLPRQSATPHRLSPLLAFWPENGKPMLTIQPGVSMVDAELWAYYSKSCNEGQGHPQLVDKIERHQLREITAVPADTWHAIEMIKGSIDPAGLAWLAEQEQAGAGRQDVLDAIDAALAKARPVGLKPTTTFKGKVLNVRRGEDRNEPVTAAMG
jgi:hypothetical protein